MQAAKKTITIREALRAKAGLAADNPVAVSVDNAAIENGRKPLTARRQDVAALQAKFRDLYETGTALPRIDATFKFTPAESDADFNYLHVEPLLEHASKLLDRCALYRSAWDELQTAKWSILLEVDQSLRGVQVDERDREAGGDTLHYRRVSLESAAEQSLQQNHKGAETQLRALTNDLVESGLNKRMSAREASAWLSGYPLKDGDLRGDDAAYTFDGVRKSKPEHLFDAARKEADQDAWDQVYALVVQMYAAIAAAEAARLRKESLDLESKFALGLISSSRERQQIARDAMWEKVYQLQAPGGLVNYHERIAEVQGNFLSELREAVACLMAVEHGMKELYDFATPLPKPGSAAYSDSLLAWRSQATNRMLQISRLDQSYVLVVSLKDVTKSQWESGLTSAEWIFDIPGELFAGQSYVRLRGVGLSVVGPDPDVDQKPSGRRANVPLKAEGFWSARVSLPAKGSIRNSAGGVKDVDQKSVGACYLGQVRGQDSRDVDMGGLSTLHNASPIGHQWKLKLSAKSTAGMPTESLQDVLLHLHVAVRG